MIRTSLLLMVVFTVLFAVGLRWREGRLPDRPAARRAGPFARQRAGLDRWVTAAALAAVASLLVLGGLQWFRVWQG